LVVNRLKWIALGLAVIAVFVGAVIGVETLVASSVPIVAGQGRRGYWAEAIQAVSTVVVMAATTVYAVIDRLGRYEPAATIAGFAVVSPMTAAAIPEVYAAIAHLRYVLGDQTYESLARKGETMTTAAMATYAYDQIDQARTGLDHPTNPVQARRNRATKSAASWVVDRTRRGAASRLPDGCSRC
jgi:hypothetical protein